MFYFYFIYFSYEPSFVHTIAATRLASVWFSVQLRFPLRPHLNLRRYAECSRSRPRKKPKNKDFDVIARKWAPLWPLCFVLSQQFAKAAAATSTSALRMRSFCIKCAAQSKAKSVNKSPTNEADTQRAVQWCSDRIKATTYIRITTNTNTHWNIYNKKVSKSAQDSSRKWYVLKRSGLNESWIPSGRPLPE